MWRLTESAVELQTGSAEYSTELAFYLNMSNLIYLNVAFYMHFIWQLK